VVRELGSERCKTVWLLSAIFLYKTKKFNPSTRGPVNIDL
jgi:hypothetical protein